MKTGLSVLLVTIAIARTNNGVHGACKFPANGLTSWHYNSKAEGPYGCTLEHDDYFWSTLNAYRSGGTQNVHWKYTNDLNDPACLNNWKYYSNDGQTLLSTISGRTTTQNDPKRWYPLPVYRPGGVQGKQWNHCDCHAYIVP